MTSTNKLFRCIGPAIFCLVFAGLSQAQAFVFASPNTRTHMPDSVAVASQDSFEQQNFLAVARYLAAQLCPAAKPRVEMDLWPDAAVEASTGLDGPGAENSLMILGCKDGPAAYLSLLLARYGHQKWGLAFVPSKNGPERLFVITLSGIGVEQTLAQMRKHGLTEGTVVLQKNRIQVYVWVQKNLEQEKAEGDSVHKNVRAFAGGNHGELQEITGTGKLVGDEDRAKAQRVLDENIACYERAHGIVLSRLLWTKKLREMELSPPETPSSLLKTNPAGHGVPSGLPLAP
jgi:hypothetical protein